jgi:DNA-binding transcriptional MocR family regulator
MIPTLPTWQIDIPEGLIDLGVGDPSFSLLPLERMRRAADACFARNNPTFLQYGAEQGDGYFRRALSGFLTRGYGCEVDADSLFVTNGISSALNLICDLFTHPGDVIFVEEPSYFLALRIFADHDLTIVPIPMDNDGLIVAALEEKLNEYRPKLLYIIPAFQNPSGRTLARERREQLIALSRERNFLIVADEVYQLLHYTGKTPLPFAAHSAVENVISLGSFSKILAPGLRLGWIQAHPGILKRLTGSGMLASGGGMNPFTSLIVRELIEAGELDRNVAELISIYSDRLIKMDAALKRHLPQAEYDLPQGGYFFWIRLPGEQDALELQRRAESFKVGFRPGIRFSSEGGLRDYLRLCFAFYNADEITEGIVRLSQCVEMRRP